MSELEKTRNFRIEEFQKRLIKYKDKIYPDDENDAARDIWKQFNISQAQNEVQVEQSNVPKRDFSEKKPTEVKVKDVGDKSG